MDCSGDSPDPSTDASDDAAVVGRGSAISMLRRRGPGSHVLQSVTSSASTDPIASPDRVWITKRNRPTGGLPIKVSVCVVAPTVTGATNLAISR